MAVASNPLETFIWGAGGQKMSPEQVARQREIAAALMQGGMDYSPVGHWTQGLARASQGLVGGLKDRWAGEAEQRGREGFQSQWDSVFGGSASPVAAALSETTPALDAANQMAGAPVTDWLEYANQGATRNQPLAPELVTAMSFLPEMGVTMRVVSGGQEASGPNRVGSTRHDHGNAGDVDFYQNGRKLDWNNEADLPLLRNIVSQARANGVTGIGAGDDYMGAGRFHIGFGNEAVWGAGGKSENAPDWLRAAYSGAPAPARTQVAQAGGGNPSVAQLLSLAGNEWANPGQSSVVSALLGQAMQQQDPRYQQDLAMGDLQLRQLQQQLNAQPYQPRVLTPEEMEQWGLPSNSGTWVLPENGIPQNLYSAPAPNTDFETITIDVPGVGPQTFNTADPQQYQIANDLLAQGATEIKTPGVSVSVGGNNDIGTIPQGMMVERDAAGNVIGMRPIPGGPAEAEALAAQAAAEAGQDQTSRYGNVVVEDIGRALELVENDPALSTGIVGQALKGISGTPANRLENLLNTVRANSAFDRLQAMRAASPTGGALGAVSERELTLLQSAIGSLETGDPKDLAHNLRRLQAIYNEIIHGPQASPPPNQSTPPRFSSQAEFDAAPSGTVFQAPDGSIRVKP